MHVSQTPDYARPMPSSSSHAISAEPERVSRINGIYPSEVEIVGLGAMKSLLLDFVRSCGVCRAGPHWLGFHRGDWTLRRNRPDLATAVIGCLPQANSNAFCIRCGISESFSRRRASTPSAVRIGGFTGNGSLLVEQ